MLSRSLLKYDSSLSLRDIELLVRPLGEKLSIHMVRKRSRRLSIHWMTAIRTRVSANRMKEKIGLLGSSARSWAMLVICNALRIWIIIMSNHSFSQKVTFAKVYWYTQSLSLITNRKFSSSRHSFRPDFDSSRFRPYGVLTGMPFSMIPPIQLAGGVNSASQE